MSATGKVAPIEVKACPDPIVFRIASSDVNPSRVYAVQGQAGEVNLHLRQVVHIAGRIGEVIHRDDLLAAMQLESLLL